LGSWTHLATTFNGSSLQLYVNGALVRTTARTGSILVSTGALQIGGNNFWGEYFGGLIDEVRVYNRALTAAEIQSDMNVAIGDALTAAAAPFERGNNSGPLTPDVLNELQRAAIARWESAGMRKAVADALHAVPIRITDLPGLQLGLASADTIWIDIDGAGHGWFIDDTPYDDLEFPALQGSESSGRMDLLTVLLHEYGHIGGQNHSEDAGALMAELLGPGERRRPEKSRAGVSTSYAGRCVASVDTVLLAGDLRDILFGSTQTFCEDRGPTSAKRRLWRW
jgi:hypothetical protein